MVSVSAKRVPNTQFLLRLTSEPNSTKNHIIKNTSLLCCYVCNYAPATY